MFIGLMGLGSDGTLYTPSGKKLFRMPKKLGRMVQRIQHWVAIQTWGEQDKEIAGEIKRLRTTIPNQIAKDIASVQPIDPEVMGELAKALTKLEEKKNEE